jgi:predicted tellurium resistance membrane protein TerC
MEIFLKPESWGALTVLVFLEIILGIDNVIFISIATNRLPREERSQTRFSGLTLALIIRIVMLFTISQIIGFKEPLFNLFETQICIRDLIMSAGGIFLIYKSTQEISNCINSRSDGKEKKTINKKYSKIAIILQIIFIDFIFSFDSILTAVGLSNVIALMVTAVIISMLIMAVFLNSIGDFIKENPSIEILALGFLILIGFILILDSFHYNIPKGYIYFAIAFSFAIELLNIRKRNKLARPNTCKNITTHSDLPQDSLVTT